MRVKQSRRGFPRLLKTALGALLVLAGAGVMVLGPPDFFKKSSIHYETLAELKPGDPGFPDLGGKFPIERISRYRIGKDGNGFEFNVAHYRDGQGNAASAIVYPTLPGQGVTSARHALWKDTVAAIVNYSPKDALFIAWWDDAQRIRFLADRETWADKPVASTYPDPQMRQFWEKATGGFDADGSRLKQLARWLSMDADDALAEMAKVLPKGRPLYFLVCLDDMARLDEIEALSGIKLPFETRIFAQAGDMHAQIAEVKRWAEATGPGSYLVQQIPSGGVRVFRISTEEGARTLLARLLPFTSSLTKPLENPALVYQSGWGGYLSVYQWRR